MKFYAVICSRFIFNSPLPLNVSFKYSDFSAEIQKVIKYAFISRKRLVQLSGGFKRLLKFKFHTQGHECFLFIRLPKIWLKYSLYQKWRILRYQHSCARTRINGKIIWVELWPSWPFEFAWGFIVLVFYSNDYPD